MPVIRVIKFESTSKKFGTIFYGIAKCNLTWKSLSKTFNGNYLSAQK